MTLLHSAGPRTRRRPLAPQALALVLVLIVLVAAATACSSGGSAYGPAPTATTAPKPAEPTKAPAAPTSAAAAPTAAPAPAATTAGSLADAGKTVFAGHCAGCHGANGQGGAGPSNIGPANQLAKYGTGKGLYDKVSTTMPRSAPGTLTADQYLQVTAFLLVQNNFVKAADPLDASKLAAVAIK
jgi:mono/diheme cytochrome c family protein